MEKEKLKEIEEKIVSKKKIGKEDFDNLIFSYTKGEISDDEILPIVKAIYDFGLCDKDLFYLTDAMKNSGECLDLSELGTVVDKHSTGGVSDTTTIILVPICASLGIKMLKLSGRGLGFTGGTCDKLESFDGYQTAIPLSKAIELVKQNNACMMTSSMEIAPADKKLYALRNRTGLVDNIQLIASSIMSKKLAGGANIDVLDVKYGNGAFMPNKKMAKQLGKKMKKIGKLAGKKMHAVYGRMDQPLGYNIGPKLECMEAIQILSGKQKGTLYYESVRLATFCVALAKRISLNYALSKVLKAIKSGAALNKLKTMIRSQGGSLDLFSEQYKTPTLTTKSKLNGKVVGYNTKMLGEIVAKMGTTKFNDDDKIFYDLGVRTFFKIGNSVKQNDTLFEIYAKDLTQAKEVEKQLLSCIFIE